MKDYLFNKYVCVLHVDGPPMVCSPWPIDLNIYIYIYFYINTRVTKTTDQPERYL